MHEHPQHANAKLSAAYQKGSVEEEPESQSHIHCSWIGRVLFINVGKPYVKPVLLAVYYACVRVRIEA